MSVAVIHPAQFSLLPQWEPPLRFVVHQHETARVHYDLRLEYMGELMSFILPVGPSIRPEDRRQALRVENKSLSYLNNDDGHIPFGQRGAGYMLCWDAGLFVPVKPVGQCYADAIEQGIRRGELRLRFSGQKLRGDWILRVDGTNGVFQKARDAHAAQYDILEQDESVLSGCTLGELRSLPYPLDHRRLQAESPYDRSLKRHEILLPKETVY